MSKYQKALDELFDWAIDNVTQHHDLEETYLEEEKNLIQELIDKNEKLREYIYKNLDFDYYSKIEESTLSKEIKDRYNALEYRDGLKDVLSFLDNEKGFSDDY